MNIVYATSIASPTKVLTNILTLILLLTMFTIFILSSIRLGRGAYGWLTSGGDKKAIDKARGRIIKAIIGFALIVIIFALITAVDQFLVFVGFKPSTKINIPSPIPSIAPF